MSDYMARAAGMLDQVLYFARSNQVTPGSGADATMTPADLDRLTTSLAQERDSFLKKVPDYLEVRKRCLQALSSDMTLTQGLDKDYESRWPGHSTALAEAPRVLNALLDGVNTRSTAAVELRAKFLREEEHFATGLASINIGLRWKKLGDLDRGLSTMGTALRVYWPMLLSKADEIDSRAGDACRRLTDGLRNERSNASSWWPAYTQALKECATELARIAADTSATERALDNFPTRLRACSDAMEAHSRAIRENTGLARGLIGELQGYQTTETATIHRLFHDARRNTAEFMREPVDQRAATILRETEEMVNAWLSGCVGAGQRADAEVLRDELFVPARVIATGLVDLYKRFVDENVGRFIGDTEKATALLHTEQWTARAQALRDLDVPNTYRFMLEQADRGFDARVLESYDAILASVREGRDGMRIVATRQRDEWAGRYNMRLSELRSAFVDAAQTYGNERFTALFTRDEVARSLRG